MATQSRSETKPQSRSEPRRGSGAAPLSPLKKVTLIAAVVAAIHEAGMRNVLASTLLTIAGPVTATAFVYEVKAMRHAELDREAADRAAYAAKLAAEADDPDSRRAVVTPVALPTDPVDMAQADMTTKLDAMLKSRAVILDTFGEEASAVAPVYASIIKQMLKEDEDAFATLATQPPPGSIGNSAQVADRLARLRAMHQRLSLLAGA
jgi:hypothetical protein